MLHLDTSTPYPQALLAAILLACLLSTTGAAQTSGVPSNGTLAVGGDVPQPFTMKLAELRSLPRTTVTAQDHGKTATYEGVLVSELLTRAGTPLGAELRGRAIATYVVASAPDGYQAVFSLPELDPEFTGSEIIVADTVDGKPLPADQGPLRIVAPKDKRNARSIRMLERLQVVRLRK